MLFDVEPADTDHLYFTNLSNPEFRPDIMEWCEETYARAQPLLDEDFPARFRRETPQRISELLFAAAFLDAGWKPVGRVPGFDLAFEMGSGRLLVEVTAPGPHSDETWEEETRDGVTVWSADATTEDAELLRLTGGFFTKAEKIRQRCEKDEISDEDYVVIALSAFQLSQETPRSPEIGGTVPDFAKGFLPIGSRVVIFKLNERPVDGGWEYKPTIEREGKEPIPRDAFLQPDFKHIHAIAYTPLHFGEPINPIQECAALHNPMARPKAEAVRLGLGHEYGVEIGEDDFSLSPL